MSGGSPKKIAFYGGMANNCYLVCARMRELGFDAIYIRDRLDNYAISQPLWEDHPFEIGYAELNASSDWSPRDWDDLARAKGWQAPHWLIDPVNLEREAELDKSALSGDADLLEYNPSPTDHDKKIMALMREQDLIFASNVHAIILALYSGVPFVICPAGGEFMVASGLISGEGDVGRTLERQRRLLMIAFRRAAAVLTNTAFLQHRQLVGGLQVLIREFWNVRFKRVSLPYKCSPQLNPSGKRARLDQILADLGKLPLKNAYTVFVPSRIDYQWKGQDRIVEALKLVDRPDDFAFVFTGWGADYADFVQRTARMGNFCVLNAAFSKPRLCDMYQSFDMVIDQFTLGHIGSAAREASAVGTPVMAWIEGPRAFWQRRPELPVLNARHPQQIAGILNGIVNGDIDLQLIGRQAQDWVRAYSGPEQMGAALEKYAMARSARRS